MCCTFLICINRLDVPKTSRLLEEDAFMTIFHGSSSCGNCAFGSLKWSIPAHALLIITMSYLQWKESNSYSQEQAQWSTWQLVVLVVGDKYSLCEILKVRFGVVVCLQCSSFRTFRCCKKMLFCRPLLRWRFVAIWKWFIRGKMTRHIQTRFTKYE